LRPIQRQISPRVNWPASRPSREHEPSTHSRPRGSPCNLAIRSSQAQYIIPNHLAQADPLIQRFERWARGHLKQGFSLHEAANALATSPRTLQRRCEAVLGKSPLSYFQDLRVEKGQSLLHGSGLDVEAIAAEVGYADGATLRSLLRERLGRGVRELRADLR
jgi:transcriptional regulator GlxA family with amidase domain